MKQQQSIFQFLQSYVFYAMVGGFLLSIPAQSFAVPDYKVFPGASCQLEYPTNYGIGGASSWSLWGGAYENTHSDLTNGYDHVICPIVRDKTRNLAGTEHVRVSIYNSGNGRKFSCDLWSVDKFGGSNNAFPGFPVPLETYTAVAPAAGFIDLVLDLTQSTVSGYYALHCEVPPLGYIYRYEVGEFQDTAVR